MSDLDLMEILGRSEAAYSKVIDQFIDADGTPDSVRQHFNRDVPALISTVKFLGAELERDRQELGRLRREHADRDPIVQAAKTLRDEADLNDPAHLADLLADLAEAIDSATRLWPTDPAGAHEDSVEHYVVLLGGLDDQGEVADRG